MMGKKQKEVGDGDSEESCKSILPSLPFDIIAYDILTRIPIDCLMPFRCVCKSWSSLILNDSDFIKFHPSRTYASPGFLRLSGNYPDSHFYEKGSDDENSDNENSADKNSDNDNSDDDDSDGDYDRREPQLEETEAFQDWQRGVEKSKGISFYDIGKDMYKLFYFRRGLFNKKLKIRGSFYGLVILSCEERDYEFTHHVYNPNTRNSVQLPTLNEFDQRHIDDLPYFYLVFDPVMDKYKVICIAWNYIEILPRHIVKVLTTQFFFKIVTLGTGAGSDLWRDVDIPKMSFRLGGDGYKAVSVNGSLNLLCPVDRKVLHIDVGRESFYTIEYPEGASNTSKLLEIEGSLCILDYTEESRDDIESKGKFTLWFLTEDEETKKWMKKFNIDMFHNPYVARPYKYAPVFVAAISNPTLKIIFSVASKKYDYDDDVEYRYYSFDVESKRLESISNPYPLEYRQWHINRLTHI